MEILVLHPGALGDIILSLPALSLLRRHYPRAGLTLAGNLDFLRAVAGGYADRRVSLSTLPLHRLYSPDPVPEEDIRLWTSFKYIVSWTGAGDDAFTGKLASTGASVLVSAWKPHPTDGRHVARIFVESLYPLIPSVDALPLAPIEVALTYRNEARRWLADHGWTSRDQLLALHPGAGSAAKRWKLAGFKCLADRHLRQNGKILLAEGPAETGLGGELARDLAPERVLVAESLPLAQLAALFTFCRAYVGNDSGISHLAAGLGLPSVVLFGVSSPEQWAPMGKRVAVVTDSCLGRITPDGVWDALKRIADCFNP